MNLGMLYAIEMKFGKDYSEVGNELLFHCPHCKELGKTISDRKLYVNSKTGKYICFRCGIRGRIRSAFGGGYVSTEDAFSRLTEFLEGNSHDVVVDESYLLLPEYHLSDYPDSIPYRYMIERGLTPEDFKKYDFRIYGEGPLCNRVVIPNKIVLRNWTDFYTARAIFSDIVPKYWNSKFVNKSEIVYNLFRVSAGGDLIINEGCINSIIAGDNSVAILGKSISKSQLFQICRLKSKRIFISLDYDAKDQALALASKLKKFTSSEIRLVELPDGEDASSMGKKLYQDCLNDSKIISSGNYSKILENFISF